MIVENKSGLPIYGLNTDYSYDKIPENYYPFALNVVHDSEYGEMNTVSNEKGTELIHTLRDSQKHIGTIYLSDETFIIFATDGNDINTIGKFNGSSYTELLSNSCLNFSLDYENRITGVHRVINGCDEIIYFRDSLNPDRRINLSKIEDGIYNDANGDFDCNLVELNPDYIIPNMSTEALPSGNLKEGAYQFSIAYLDAEFNVVYRSYLTLPEYVIKNDHGSVKLTLSKLDTRFDYINIYVTVSDTGDGTTTKSYLVKENFVLQNDQIDYVLNNITTDALLVTLDELVSKNIIYETSRSMTQVNNRLLRADLTEKYRDYSVYQKYANSIITKWVSKLVPFDERHQSFMGGETESFGIVFIHTNGDESPVFHIPCKTDFTILPNTPTGFYRHGYCASKICSNTNYTDPLCADNYWHDLDGNDLSGTSVKNFITPDRDIVSFGGSEEKRVIGYNFTNIQYPDDVIGHYIVKAKRDESNKTIVSKGFSSKLTTKTTSGGVDYLGFTYLQPQEITPTDTLTAEYLYFISPDTLYNRKLYNADEYTKIYEFRTTEVVDTSVIGQDNKTGNGTGHCLYFDGAGSSLFTGLGSNRGDLDSVISVSYLTAGASRFDTIRQYSTIEKNKYFEFLQKDVNKYKADTVTINTSYLNPIQFIKLETPVSWIENNEHSLLYGALVNKDRDVFCDLYSIEYVRTHNDVKVGETTVFQGDVWVSQMHLSNAMFVRETNGGVMDVSSRILGSALIGAASALGAQTSANDKSFDSSKLQSALSSTAAGTKAGPQGALIAAGVGAALGVGVQAVKEFISSINKSELSQYTSFANHNIKNAASHLTSCGTGNMEFHGEVLQNIYVENEIDVSLRERETLCGDIYNVESNDYVSYLRDKLLTFDFDADAKANRRYVPMGSVCPELYRYNYDYSKKQVENIYYPIKFTYDFCSDCINKYPNRIIWSAVSADLNQGNGDVYSVYAANSILEIPANRGSITSLNYEANKLVVNTKESNFLMQTNPSRIQTDASNIYVDTGDFLSIAPVELTLNDTGYAGNKTGEVIKTPYGLVWVDTLASSKVMLYNGQLKELSQDGMYHYFRNKIYSQEGEEIHLAYDNIYKRLMVTYKYIVNNENRSFTLSFSFKSMKWTSFHSILPDTLFNNNLTFYSSLDSELYRHSTGNYNHFYGNYEKHIIEYNVNNMLASSLDSIYYYSICERYDRDTKSLYEVDKTFNSFIAYAEGQSTGEQLLQYNANSDSLNLLWSNTKTVIRTNNIFKISAIRDMSTSNIIFTSDWSNISNDYFIDKIPVNVNDQTPLFNQNLLKGKWFNVRLIFDDQENTKIKTDMMSINTRINIR